MHGAGQRLSGRSTPTIASCVLQGIEPAVTASTDEETATMSFAGELVTDTFEYDGGRQVTVYVPPGYARGHRFRR